MMHGEGINRGILNPVTTVLLCFLSNFAVTYVDRSTGRNLNPRGNTGKP